VISLGLLWWQFVSVFASVFVDLPEGSA
jgi:hypothetical protein